jgi:DNA-directed RNA polymerase specialized sigma24 family protein
LNSTKPGWGLLRGGGNLVVALDDALQELAKFDARKSQVVEMRFFGGLSAEETAEVLKVSEDTLLRDWKLAKSWLLRELKKDDEA